MALIPMFLSQWWQDNDHPHRIFSQNFGHGLNFDQFHQSYFDNLIDLPVYGRCPVRNSLYVRNGVDDFSKKGQTESSTVKTSKGQLQVILDVQHFKPGEINVKIVDNYVIVDAKHEEKKDEHGWISRQFLRKYMIPEEYDIDRVTSDLSIDGVLSINAPRKDSPKLENERKITIEYTGKPAVLEKAPKVEIEKEEKNVQESDN